MKSSLLMCNPVYIPTHTTGIEGSKSGAKQCQNTWSRTQKATGSRKSTLGGPADRLPPARFPIARNFDRNQTARKRIIIAKY